MGDCSTQAWNAPRGIDGAIHWNIGESELHFARYVNGEERKAEYVEIDGVKFAPERTCRIVKEKRTLRSMLHGECEVVDEKCSECGGYMDVGFGVIRNYCPNCGARVVSTDD